MSKHDKFLLKILTGKSDTNISFKELCHLILSIGFSEKIKGSHHIYYMQDIEEIINIQPDKDKAKPYQVKQIRNLIIKYKLGE